MCSMILSNTKIDNKLNSKDHKQWIITGFI
jgi:hypothetical protein